jgi:hypothetical protein
MRVVGGFCRGSWGRFNGNDEMIVHEMKDFWIKQSG